jgi:hypothetical protein
MNYELRYTGLRLFRVKGNGMRMTWMGRIGADFLKWAVPYRGAIPLL